MTQNNKVTSAESGSGTEIAPRSSFWALMLGSIGVVYGDIGTSPL
jgi:KUP system potassium uptake protein